MMMRMTMHGHGFVRKGEMFIGHVVAIVVGLALTVIGLGMGVTMVMLPVGVVVGVVGVLMVVWGLFGSLQGHTSPGG